MQCSAVWSSWQHQPSMSVVAHCSRRLPLVPSLTLSLSLSNTHTHTRRHTPTLVSLCVVASFSSPNSTLLARVFICWIFSGQIHRFFFFWVVVVVSFSVVICYFSKSVILSAISFTLKCTSTQVQKGIDGSWSGLHSRLPGLPLGSEIKK